MRTNEELIRDYRAGDADALNELAKQNRGLIARVANRWCMRKRHWDDTFQECSLAFLLAAHGFDLSRKFKFSTYATVAMNRHMKNLVIYRSAQKRTANTVNLHNGMRDHSRTPLELAQVRLDASEALRLIPKARTRKVVWLSMSGYTLLEISKKLGVSFERVRQIKRKGLDQIREICLT